ncbi:multiple inositol polyphosphate phosphatase 1-like [Amphiura filiformis]|uniref:multiple inositol polyphosphate phosphatase 1-like n=1 Tax=Amphiura filiformis TaxID=82378 RepID=UPI003B228681
MMHSSCTRMEIKRVSVIFVFLMVLTTVQCELLMPKYSTKTSYDLSFNKSNILKRELSWQQLATEFSPELQTCNPIGLYVVYRHGSRYPSEKDIKKFNLFLERARNESINPEFEYLRNDTDLEIPVNLHHKLSESGKLEMNHIAKRMKKRFADLFQDQLLTNYAFQSSKLSRTIDSTISFIQGFVDDETNCSSALTEDELLVTCQKSSSSMRETVVVPLHNKTSDYLLRFFDAYEDCLKEQKDSDEDDELESTRTDQLREDAKFVEGKEVAGMQHRLSQKLSVPGAREKFNISREEAIDIAKMCGFQLALFNHSGWCNLLSDEDLRLFEYKQDLKHYWKRGYGHKVNYLVGCNLVRDIASYFGQLTTGLADTPKGVFKFAHAETIVPLECLMGLYKDKRPLTATSYQDNHSRLFRTSWMTPFAANIAFVLFNCSSEADDANGLTKYKLQVFMNEIPVDLPFCRSGPCDLIEFSTHIRKVSGECNFNNTCCFENCGGARCMPFQFNEWTIFCISVAAVAFVAWMLILMIELRYSGAKYIVIKNH